ncbi:MAG: hypothetical protein M1833_001338 [Piccolia ochrophora]|nr:MAG: hypothetical protein M1833_001338 [Piccolia ochrophora]
MTLEEFEKSLAESKAREESAGRSEGHKDTRKHRHRHPRHSSRHRPTDEENDDRHRHRHKRRRHSSQDRDDSTGHGGKSSRRDRSLDPEKREEDLLEVQGIPQPPTDDTEDGRSAAVDINVKRDAWMEAPSSLDVQYTQRGTNKPSGPIKLQSSRPDYDLKLHENELNHHLKDLVEGRDVAELAEKPAQHEVDYVFGDEGSRWRMTKLKAVYRQAEETGTPLDDIASERYGDLREFDDAREEQTELDRRETYGEGYVGKVKPSGELFEERKLQMGIRREQEAAKIAAEPPQSKVIDTEPAPAKTVQLDQTALNRLKAQMMKAKLKGSSDLARLEAEYNAGLAGFANRKEPGVVVLGAMENRMLAGGRKGEVKQIDNTRGRERGHVEDNEDMSIEDMVRQERRTRGQAGGDGQRFAERIAKDAKFDNDLDYLDENATKLAKRVAKSDINLKNTAVNDFQKMNRILENCPLCHHEDTETPPVAPLVSLATRVYLTLPTDPEISEGGACIVPIQHRINLLECDDDEWEEIRNFMKCLTRMYHAQGRAVIFYENAAFPQRKKHAAMEAVPLPYSLGETAPAFFKEAILSNAPTWTQHRPLIQTLTLSQTTPMGKHAFRRSLAKEMPYFHVWFELDGGLGHVVEDEARWPRGELFARETLGGMLDRDMEIIRRQGRWTRGDKGRERKWREKWGWAKWDWTGVLTEAA